jgi:hypothetical protein
MAPGKALDAVEAAITLPFADGIRREAELFRECLFSDQSKGLIHVFFGERAVARVPGLGRDVTPLPIRRAAAPRGSSRQDRRRLLRPAACSAGSRPDSRCTGDWLYRGLARIVARQVSVQL